jgi:hypothetical protein
MRILAIFLLATALHAQSFPVYDATYFINKPDLSQYGIKPFTIIYQYKMWPGKFNASDTKTMPDRSMINAAVKGSTGLVAIDIEHWPITDPESIKKLETVFQWFKSADPQAKIGYYGIIPQRDYWNTQQGANSAKYHSWQQTNDSVAPLANMVDVVFPSLYTFYPDSAAWQKYAIAQIQEAKRLAPGKPVYAFLWPQYHTSNRFLGGQYLPADYWTLELNTVKKYADGAVIWCCPDKETWNPQAPWWKATVAFLQGK